MGANGMGLWLQSRRRHIGRRHRAAHLRHDFVVNTSQGADDSRSNLAELQAGPLARASSAISKIQKLSRFPSWRYAANAAMKDFGFRFPVIFLCALAGACGSGTAPTPAGYAGQWIGTTAQGRSIAFTISADEAVTTITVAHDFNGCSGS